jgi:hypothetical protein
LISFWSLSFESCFDLNLCKLRKYFEEQQETVLTTAGTIPKELRELKAVEVQCCHNTQKPTPPVHLHNARVHTK